MTESRSFSPLSPSASSPSSGLTTGPGLAALLAHVAQTAERAKVFGPTETPAAADSVGFAAQASAAPAFYRLGADAGRLWVSLVTPDRYLSQSIEQELVHTGDKMSDLLGDELIDMGKPMAPLPVEHYRSPAKLFTFRTAVPLTDADLATAVPSQKSLELCATLLLAFERTFGPLGGMSAGDDEE